MNDSSSTSSHDSPAGPDAQALRHRGHAPTLAGSVASGGEGAIRVWRPEDRDSKLMAPLSILFGFVYLGLSLQYALSHTGLPGLAWVWTVFGVGWFASAYIHWNRAYRPRYLATDNGGIALTTRKGSRAIRWDEIWRMRCPPDTGCISLETTAGERVSFPSGFVCQAEKQRELRRRTHRRSRLPPGFVCQAETTALITLIQARCQLRQDPERPNRFVRSDDPYPFPPPAARPPLAPRPVDPAD